ncbi:hypothetical protein QWY31_07570 [Cytophagales bacterium LB-30]|uniref:Uncharacterized protein n=1 Tax=Shiella aurantiaca TaxID=3058365 RepID=A0ABT8F4H8_9BACT|nr:hypothetical protein [Shiella aurantiaca]MDN4165355.1 hypothetical protein [Shiella aurantiaca]
MDADALLFDERLGQLRIQSKKLSSGKCQIKFYLLREHKPELYGYTLAEANETVREVVIRIRKRLLRMRGADGYFHRHLFELGRSKQYGKDILIFDL